jgi:hypothetical protein
VIGNFRVYRRLRGGCWATVTGWFYGRRWVRLGPKELPIECEECW